MEPPLRIAFLDSWKSDAFDGSGTAVGIRNLATGLTLLGHQVSVVRPKGRSPTLAHRILFNLRLPRRLAASGPFDSVVGFDIDGFRWASARGRSRPYVVSLKGIAADEARFARSRGERLALSALARLERRNALGADRVFVPSRYSAGVARDAYGVPGERIRVVPEAVDLAPWRAARAARTGGRPPTILSVARQYPRKDTAVLLRAIPGVLDRHPDARLRVIGGGPELGHLHGLVRDLGIGASVTLEGEVPGDAEVREAFVEADVFCLPSLQEGFGIAFVEAMAAAIPIVAARAGAVPELVEDGATGVLVPPHDPEALAGALIGLLGNPELRGRLGSEGARRAERYDLQTVAGRFVEEIRFRPGS